MAIKTLVHNHLTWINIDQVDEEAKKYLTDRYAFHPLDIEDVETEQQTPKMDVYKDYLFLVLQFPHWDGESKKVVAHEIDIFIGPAYLITIQGTKSKELKNFFYRCMASKQAKDDWMNLGSGYLFYQILEELFENTRPILNNFGKTLSALEEKIFSGNQQSGAILELSTHRRNVLSFRRILDPERQFIQSLNNALPKFLITGSPDINLHNYFDNINDHLNNLWSITTAYKDTIDGLHVTVESLLKRRANKIITVLTVISTAFLPPTLFTSAYGMNINLPFEDSPRAVFVLLIASIVLTIAMMIILQRKKWL